MLFNFLRFSLAGNWLLRKPRLINLNIFLQIAVVWKVLLNCQTDMSVFSRRWEKIVPMVTIRHNSKFQYCSNFMLLRRAHALARISQGCAGALWAALGDFETQWQVEGNQSLRPNHIDRRAMRYSWHSAPASVGCGGDGLSNFSRR